MITMYSFLISVFWGSVLTLLLFLCRRSTKFIEIFGVNILLFLYAVCIMRFCFPFEFHFTKEIETPKLYNPINNLLYQNSIKDIAVYQILLILWLAVSLLLFLHFILKYVKFVRIVNRIPHYRTKQMEQVIGAVIPEADRHRVCVVPIKQDGDPQTTGFFKAYILIPHRQYKKKELSFILLHEYTHFKKRDSFIKLTAEIVRIIFWWNPFVYLLKSELNSILEMRCDRIVSQNRKQSEARYYLKTILKYASQDIYAPARQRLFHSSLSGDNQMKQRFVVLLRYRRRKYGKAVISICFLFVLTLMLLTYLFVFQPAYYLPLTDSHFLDVYQENPDGSFTIFTGNENFVISAEEFSLMYQSITNRKDE